jgi:signal transduction histidine kinase
MKEFQLVTSASGTDTGTPVSREERLRGLSIRSRLILLVLSVLLPALIAGWWVLSLTYRLEREANQRLLEETSRALSMVLDRELAQRAVVVRALSHSRMLDGAPNIAPETLRAFDSQARRSLQGFEGWLEVRSANRLLVDTRLPPDTLPEMSTPQQDSLDDSAQVKPLQPGNSFSGYHASLLQPLTHNGKTVLNLSLSVLPEEIQRIIDQQKLAADWVAAVIDSDGRVVARHPGGTTYAGRGATADLRARLAQQKEGLMPSVTLDGVPVMLYFSTSPQGWTYLTGMPRDQFEGTVPRAVIHVALGGLLLLGLALMGTIGVSRSIARPIIMLKDLAGRMQSGKALAPEPTGILECDEVTRAMSRASQSIRESHNELQRQVAQAVAQTRNAEQRLSQGQRVEALGRLTGGVAHDFNNLLGVISNSAHLIQRRVDAPELQAPIQATLRAVDSGSRLTQHLLRFAGRQAVRPRQLDLAQALPDAGELMKTVLGSRIALSVAVAPQTRAVFVDPSELELTLINLALNARDAIAERGQVWLHATNATAADALGLPAGDYVIISVSDEGAGMDEATAKRAFEPFFSGKSSEPGSGLGLSQVYGFCQQAGGTARLDSTPGVGTTVSLLLPAPPGEAAPAHPPAPPADSGIAGARVLLIEDNEALRSVTAALLTSYGCVVTAGATASEALQLVQTAGPFDVVLTDVLMPGGMDGVALARRLQQDLPKLAVVLISGHSGDVDMTDGFPLLRKPCTPDALVAVLREAMRPVT